MNTDYGDHGFTEQRRRKANLGRCEVDPDYRLREVHLHTKNDFIDLTTLKK